MFRVSMFRRIHPCSPIATYLHSCCATSSVESKNNNATRTRTTWVTGKPSHARVRAAAAAAAAAQEELKENQKDPEEARLLQVEKDVEEVRDEIERTTSTGHLTPVTPTTTPTPFQPPQRRQRLKGIKHNHRWWTAFHGGRLKANKSIHKKYFIVKQHRPDDFRGRHNKKHSKGWVDSGQELVTETTMHTDLSKQRDPDNPYDDLIVGFVTSKKQISKRAVDRNRVRRRVKDAARKIFLNELDSSFWYVVICLNALSEASYEEICESLTDVKEKLTQHQDSAITSQQSDNAKFRNMLVPTAVVDDKHPPTWQPL